MGWGGRDVSWGNIMMRNNADGKMVAKLVDLGKRKGEGGKEYESGSWYDNSDNIKYKRSEMIDND